jgi:sugar lactone lactonase YvrE
MRRLSGWLLAGGLRGRHSVGDSRTGIGCAPATIFHSRIEPLATGENCRDRMSKWPAVTAVEDGTDGARVYVVERCCRQLLRGRPEPPILKYDAQGKLLKAWGEGMFNFPHGRDVDAQGNLWVTDARGEQRKGHQVIKFDRRREDADDARQGRRQRIRPRPLRSADRRVVAPDGDIFVTDSHRNGKNNRVSISRRMASSSRNGEEGSGPGEISEPHTIAMDSRGRLFVGDRENNRIQIFDQDGTFIDQWRQFGRPSGIYITRDDTMYVADSESGPTPARTN